MELGRYEFQQKESKLPEPHKSNLGITSSVLNSSKKVDLFHHKSLNPSASKANKLIN